MKKVVLLPLLVLGACTTTGQLTPQVCANATNIYNNAVVATNTAQAMLALLVATPGVSPTVISQAQARVTQALGLETTAKAALTAACPATS